MCRWCLAISALLEVLQHVEHIAADLFHGIAAFKGEQYRLDSLRR